jgi:hypothetical protein
MPTYPCVQSSFLICTGSTQRPKDLERRCITYRLLFKSTINSRSGPAEDVTYAAAVMFLLQPGHSEG